MERPAAFLDELLQKDSLADIVEECVAQGCALEAATQLAELSKATLAQMQHDRGYMIIGSYAHIAGVKQAGLYWQ